MGNISSIEEIEFGDKIGEGSYGEVWKAVWKGKQVAAKRILPILVDLDDSQREAILAKFKQEWEILCSIQHENIVQYYTVIHPPSPESPIIVTVAGMRFGQTHTELNDQTKSSFLRHN